MAACPWAVCELSAMRGQSNACHSLTVALHAGGEQLQNSLWDLDAMRQGATFSRPDEEGKTLGAILGEEERRLKALAK